MSRILNDRMDDEILILIVSDYWTWDESVAFYRESLRIDAELGFENLVCHETHRNRSLSTPYVTDYILQRVPQ